MCITTMHTDGQDVHTFFKVFIVVVNINTQFTTLSRTVLFP